MRETGFGAGIYYSSARLDMMEFMPASYRKVLEIGCGEGRFLAGLDQAAELWGVEPCAAIQVPLHRAICGRIEDVLGDLPDEYFDVVICNDVIEHVADHDALLEAIHGKLNRDGVLVASVPNVAYYRNLRELLFRGDWKYVDSGILDRTHLRFFTRRSLLRALGEHGFKVVRFCGINENSRFKFFILLINLLTLFRSRDCRYLQFALQARKQSSSG